LRPRIESFQGAVSGNLRILDIDVKKPGPSMRVEHRHDLKRRLAIRWTV
jgi:hypothetical protein